MDFLYDEDMLVQIGTDYGELREGVRRICAKYPNAYWERLDEERGYPTEFVRDLTDGGYLAVLIPEEFGGSGLPMRAAGIILEEISASGAPSISVHAQMYTMGTVLRHGSDEQKRRYLPKIAAGELRLQAFGVTEPTTGSDTTQLKTKAVRDGDDYVVNGQKIWTSRANHSDLMLLLVRTTPASEVKKRTDGITVLLVDINESVGRGMEIRPIKTMLNHDTNEVFYNDLRVPVANRIGDEGQGFRYIFDGLNAERIVASHGCLGDCRYFIEKAVNYANQRVVFGNPIGKNQGIQFPIAKAYAAYRAADMMTRKAAALFDAGRECGGDANLAKFLASEAAWESAEVAMQTHGGFAVATEFGIERKWRESRMARIAPISYNLILAYIGQHLLGLPRSY